MSHAQTCPICWGSGAINSQPDIPGTTPGRIMSSPCHGCGGKGWVTVQDPPEHVVSNAYDTSSDKSPPIRINQ